MREPDHDHGASVVATHLVDDLLGLSLTAALPVVGSAVTAHPELASLYPLLDMAITAVADDVSDTIWHERLRQHASAMAEEARHTADTAVSIITGAQPRQIVLISQSGTVCHVLSGLARQGYVVPILCAESRPRLEGRRTASWACEHGFPVTICADAAVRCFTRQGAIAVLGCDRLGERVFRNKVGSWALQSAVREHGGCVLVAATSDKLADPRIPWPRCLPQAQTEIWDNAPPGITVVNSYFEDIPIEPETLICLGRSHRRGASWPDLTVFPRYQEETVRHVVSALSTPA